MEPILTGLLISAALQGAGELTGSDNGTATTSTKRHFLKYQAKREVMSKMREVLNDIKSLEGYSYGYRPKSGGRQVGEIITDLKNKINDFLNEQNLGPEEKSKLYSDALYVFKKDLIEPFLNAERTVKSIGTKETALRKIQATD